MSVTVDDRGRIYIPKNIREEHGSKYKIVSLESGIKLIPIPDDPVEGLREAMNGAEDIELDDVDEIVDEEARKEIREDIG